MLVIVALHCCQPHSLPAADELIVRVCVVGAHLVAIVCVIVLVLIIISLVFSWLQGDLRRHTCGSEKLGGLLVSHTQQRPRLGSLPPPLPHCTSGSAATVPPQPACHSPGSSRSPPSWSQGQQGEREDSVRSGRLRRAAGPDKRWAHVFMPWIVLRLHSFVLSPGKPQGLLGKARGVCRLPLTPLTMAAPKSLFYSASFQVKVLWEEENLVVQLPP